MIKVDAIPKGYHTITPGLIVKNAEKAIEFYKKAFAAEEVCRCLSLDGKSIMHAELKIGDSIIMLNDEFPAMGCVSPETLGGCPTSLYLYVEDADSWYDRAIKAGAVSEMPVEDMFWGDRMGAVKDPFGHKWSLATHKKDLTPEEMRKGQEAWAEKMMACSKK